MMRTWLAATIIALGGGFPAQSAPATTNGVVLLKVENQVEVSRAGARAWDKAYDGEPLAPGDRGRTGEKSQALLQMYDLSRVRIGESSVFDIQAPPGLRGRIQLSLWQGLLYLFSQDKPVEVDIRTPTATAAIRGTEFVLRQDADGRTVLTLFNGEVRLSNVKGESVTLTNLEQGVVQPGQPPAKTAVINAVNIIQWCLYYPAVLDLDELLLTASSREALREPLAAYRRGDVLRALASWPTGRQPATGAERAFFAGLLLAAGKVESAEEALTPRNAGDRQDERFVRLAEALRELIAAVKQQPFPTNAASPKLATEWLAESYYDQSRAGADARNLAQALRAARAAAATSPNFGYAWARVAELEFCFGRTGRAAEALEKALKLSPRNAQALALEGFVLSAQHHIARAVEAFDQAIAADSGLANGWLGRGLCRIKRGHAEAGLADLLTAAAVEPQRSLLRSYLGKAFADADDDARAGKELMLARQLDPKDPTSWLYSALLRQQQNRINEAIADLEESQALNDNRSLFRSRLLLDEDEAVRSANLASVYNDAGMTEVSVPEAARAVTYDYANASGHLFLSDSYAALRDPTRFNLRYETVWFNELLLANLLSPIGGGRLSPYLSLQEYSPFFQADGVGLADTTLARSDGQVTELASQYGTFGGTAWSLDLDYQHNSGVRPNNGLDSIEWYSTIKQQVTPQDWALLLVKYEDYHSGDNFQYYDPKQARPYYQFNESQQPIAVGGWHHDWAPGVQTLVLGGRLANEQDVSDRGAPQLLLLQNSKGSLYASTSVPLDVNYHSELAIYTAEVNQIIQADRVTLVAGARFQTGTFDTEATLDNPPSGLVSLFRNPAAQASTSDGFERDAVYGYLTVEPLDRLWLTAGVAYDEIQYPRNFRQPPIAPGEEYRNQLGPKAAVVWSPLPEATFRGAFDRSLGGVSLDESYRLEPTQLAGFPQTFRSLMNESVVGSVAAPLYETLNGALDLKFSTRTYVELQVQSLKSDVGRDIGLFVLEKGRVPAVPGSTREQLNYKEDSVSVGVNQLLGKYFTVGASYEFSQVELDDAYPEVPVKALAGAQSIHHAGLNEVTGYVLFNHPTGLFARLETNWYGQNNWGYAPALPGDAFFQSNLYVGCRFFRRRAAVTLGILNLEGNDYHLNPLNYYLELPRVRTYMAGLSFQF